MSLYSATTMLRKKRRIADNHDQDFNDALNQDDEPREEFKSQSTQELPLGAPPRPTTTRAIIARQSRINRAAVRKIVSNTVIVPTPVPEIDTGHNCALFYELVARNEVFQHTVIDYEEPPYHDESVLWNEDIGQEAFVLPKRIGTVTLSLTTKDMFSTMHSRDMNIFINIGRVFTVCFPLKI